MKKPTVITDDATTARLQSHHEQIQKDIAQLSPERQTEIRAMQAEVDSEIGKMNKDLDDSADIEARWRAASGLHHSKAEEVIKYMKNQPIGKIVSMFGKDWVFTPFNTVVESQIYVDTLQGRLMQLSDQDAEATIVSLMDQRRQIIDAYKEHTQKFTSLSAFGLMKLAIKRLFQRGNNG